jgi:hypothetical protein
VPKTVVEETAVSSTKPGADLSRKPPVNYDGIYITVVTPEIPIDDLQLGEPVPSTENATVQLQIIVDKSGEESMLLKSSHSLAMLDQELKEVYNYTIVNFLTFEVNSSIVCSGGLCCT